MRFVLAAILLSTTAAAQKPGSVAGSLTNSVTGVPVRDCAVILTSQKGAFRYNVVSDDAGRFQFPAVEPDPGYEPGVQCAGFTMPDRSRQTLRDRPPIAVAEGQRVENVEIKLLPLGVITGKVLDPDGEPLRGVSVQVLRYQYLAAGKRLEAMAGATTDARGQYRLFFLKPGRYLLRAALRVTPPGPPGAPGHVHDLIPDEGFLAFWYPGGPDPSQAAPIDVKPGSEQTGITFKLPRSPVFHIRGTLVSKLAQRPRVEVAACVTTLLDRNDTFPADLQPDGEFDARGVTPGQYCLAASQSNFRQIAADAMVTVADRDVAGVTLNAIDGTQIAGSIEVEGDPNYKLPARMGANLQDAATSACCSAIVPINDGSFTLQKVPPANYLFRVTGLPASLYVKSLRYGDRELPGNQIDARGAAGKLTVVVAAGTGKVSGMVRDGAGNPADHTTVSLAPKGDRAVRHDLYYTAQTHADGSFEIAGVAPGDYSAYAWEAAGEFGSPEFLKPFVAKAVSVGVSSSGTMPVDLKSITAQEMEEAQWK